MVAPTVRVVISTLLLALIPGAMIAAVTKWLTVGGRERRRRHRLTEELNLLGMIREVHPTSTSLADLENRVESQTRDYLASTNLQPRASDGRWALGVVIALAIAAWVWAALAGATPEHVTINIAFLLTVFALGIGLALAAIAIEPLIRAARRL